MSEEGRPNDTRAIALDLIETMTAMRESCYVLGMNPTEAEEHMKKFLDGELAAIGEKYDPNRVRKLTAEIRYESISEMSSEDTSIYDFSLN